MGGGGKGPTRKGRVNIVSSVARARSSRLAGCIGSSGMLERSVSLCCSIASITRRLSASRGGDDSAVVSMMNLSDVLDRIPDTCVVLNTRRITQLPPCPANVHAAGCSQEAQAIAADGSRATIQSQPGQRFE